MAIFSIGKIVSSAAKTSSYKAEQLFSLSYQTILRYIAMVVAFFMDFKILNNNKNYIASQQFNKNYYLINCKTYTVQNYVYDFFKFHNWPLFMQKKKEKLEKESNKNDIALFRYALIAPLINDIYECNSKEEYFREMAEKEHILPNGTKTALTAGTIKRWYLNYRAHGLEGLMPKGRNDAGVSRKIPISCIEKIEELKRAMPHITGKAIYKKIIEYGDLNLKDASLSSLYRFLNNNKLHTHNAVERKAFEMEFANDCWQGDTSHDPYITIDRKKVQTQLIQLIDDASRLIVGYHFFLNDTAINFQHVLKEAIATYGVPKRIFVDNGTPYKNKQLESICASLGTVLIHAKPYSP